MGRGVVIELEKRFKRLLDKVKLLKTGRGEIAFSVKSPWWAGTTANISSICLT